MKNYPKPKKYKFDCDEQYLIRQEFTEFVGFELMPEIGFSIAPIVPVEPNTFYEIVSFQSAEVKPHVDYYIVKNGRLILYGEHSGQRWRLTHWNIPEITKFTEGRGVPLTCNEDESEEEVTNESKTIIHKYSHTY